MYKKENNNVVVNVSTNKESVESDELIVNNDLKRKEVEKLLSYEEFYYTGRKATEEEMKNLPRFDETFNETVFGSEIDYQEPRTMYDAYNEIDKYGRINLFPPEVWYISVYNYDCCEPKYSLLDTLPEKLLPRLNKDGVIHGTLILDYPFDGKEYRVDFDFKTTNDVLSEIKKGFLTMYASLDEEEKPYGDTFHSIIFLRIEKLLFNPKNDIIYVSIGS